MTKGHSRFLLLVPNILTILRIVALPVVCWLYFSVTLEGRIIGFIIYTLACFTDFLDGFLARYLGVQGPFGRLLDTLADKLLLVVMGIFLIGFGPISGIHVVAIILLVVREMSILSLSQYETLTKNRVLSSGFLGKVKATFQFLFIGFLYLGDESGLYLWEICIWIGLILLWGSVLLSVLSGILYAQAVFFNQKTGASKK